MRQSFSNDADPVPSADDASAVPAAARVDAPDVPEADSAATVTAAAAISTADHVAYPSFVPAAALTSSWPDIPEALSDFPLLLDGVNGTYITCLACQ